MAKNIYLDDIRACPEGWTLARNYDECIKLLQEGDCEYLSLDHDLGDFDDDPEKEFFILEWKTGYDVVKWMVENNVWPQISITLHTANPVGRKNMRALLTRYKPDTVEVYG